MSESKFGSWSVDESPITIEYSLVVIEEIRQEVAQGFQRLSRGGVEVGGVLYGTRDGRTVRVLAMRPIECEHARGPAFLLSDKDRASLTAQLERDQEDAQLEGFVCVGWFLSHTRSEINLTESDLEIFNEYFSAPWQVAMVIRPGRGGSMRAGFFIRENDGSVRTEQSYSEFNFPDRLAGVLQAPSDRRDRERRQGPRPEAPRVEAAPRRESAAPAPSYATPSFGQYDSGSQEYGIPAPPPRSKAPWIAAGLAVLILAVGGYFGVQYLRPGTGAQPVSLTVLERDGQLRIEWNHNSTPIISASKGSLAILDGGQTKNVTLSADDLNKGNFTYQRQSGDIEVRLSVVQSDGSTLQEASRFLGDAPVKQDPAALEQAQQERDKLEAEVKRLREENAQRAERIQQLERTLRIMQTRLGLK